MTFREYIAAKGWPMERFVEIAKGWYRLEFISLDDAMYDRYLLWADRPFYELNKCYNDAYAIDCDIGSLYDWLDSKPNKEEISESLNH